MSVLEHLSQVAKAGPVENQAEGKSESLGKDTKTRDSMKMNHEPKEHYEEGQCAEKTAEQEVMSSTKVGLMFFK